MPTYLGQTTEEAARALQELFAGPPPGDDAYQDEGSAQETVDWLLSACLGAFPGHFEPLGLPGTAEELERVTPYELAGALLSRWRAKEELLGELTVRTRSISPAWKRDVLGFCARAILHKFNVRIRPQYRELFSAR